MGGNEKLRQEDSVKCKQAILQFIHSSQVLPDPLPNKNKKGESLEDFDHVLDMVGCGLQSFDYTLQDHTLVA